MKLIAQKKSVFFYLLFFIILSIAKGMGMDSGDMAFILIGLFSGVFLLTHVLSQGYTRRELVIIFIFVTLGIVTLIFSKKITVLITIIAIVFAKNIPLNRLIEVVFKFKILTFIVTIILSLLGIIENNKSFRFMENGDVITRYSLGFPHANVTYLNFFIIVLLYLYIYYDKVKLRNYVVILFLSMLLYKITDSRTGIISVIISLIIPIVLKNKKIIKNAITRKIIIFLPVICGGFSVFSGIYYSSGNLVLQKINQALTGRIELASKFLSLYKIKPFGQVIIEGSNLNGSYLRIDNGYISLLLAYGIVSFIVFIILETKLLKKYMLDERYREILLIVSFLIYGITEVYIYNIFVNISLIFLCELLYKPVSDERYLST
ncbi:hypothetical protein [Clostridium septicum]|uniref:Polysaccharide polymerase n=1 Tax=Clostridium septicum TaxID=1504 RepID=A0A9N7JJS1_CLOSE|nr:hypothetical protein [Clostridium septicum]AYE33883.1 hypothetical protein CP523_05035 [Clostridium septicum]UEC21509.1 hypothetical protein LK444_03795 [Clostridium septicum]USS00444.1 hypothetical protein NH397_13290 [Clostridium septicum]